MISSLDNPRVKLVRKLEDKKFRRSEGKFVIEGVHMVSEALSSSRKTGKFKPEIVLFSKEAFDGREGRGLKGALEEAEAEMLEVSPKVIKKISMVESPQGIIAVVKAEKHSVQDILESGRNIAVILHDVRDPGNMGTIIRSADAAQAAGVIVSGGSVDFQNPKVLRASMGSIFHLPVVEADDDLEDLLSRFKSRGFIVSALDASAKQSVFEVDLKGRHAFVFGSEGAGLPENILEKADRAVRIPMPGQSESLNVAVSASVVLYEALRQNLREDQRAHG